MKARSGQWQRLAVTLVSLLALDCGDSSAGAPLPGETGGTGGESAGAGPGGASTTAGQGGSAGSAGSAGSSSGMPGSNSSGHAGTEAGDGGMSPGDEPEPAAPLLIYWIDVEGGAATLLVLPDGQTVLVDAGNPGERDAGRIAKVLKQEVQADRLDYLISTHYHGDHVGGVPTLAAMIPIAHFYDHGVTVESNAGYDNYLATAGDERVLTKPGDKLLFGDAQLTFVTGAGEVIEPPLATALPNALCPSSVTKDKDGGAENAMSLGFVLHFGSFTFVDLGDLTWAAEQKLMCPTNRIGTIDLFQVNHHGMDISNSPQLVHALAPTVAVMNNGASKGGSPATFDVLRASPGLPDVWALHQATANDVQHNAEEALIANLAGPDEAYWIKAVVAASGSYTLSNARNGASRTYADH